MFSPESATQSSASLSSPLPQTVGTALDGYKVGDSIGAFNGYLRRPKSTSAGLLAMIFGENGHDADIISALHLTHYQDLLVKVSVWMIKDKDGRLMGANGTYPLLAEFVAQNRRPAASNAGQTAQLFGKNGPNSDAINVLNRSDYLDAFVFVEIQLAEEGKDAKDIKTDVPTPAEAGADRLVPAEAKELKKQQRRAQEATRVLQVSGFFRQATVWAALGREDDFRAWVEQERCCQPGDRPCDHHPVFAFAVPQTGGASVSYNYVPLCADHKEKWEQGQSGVANPIPFLQSRQTALVQRWAQETLREVLNTPEGFELLPQKVHAWALGNKISVPNAYLSFL